MLGDMGETTEGRRMIYAIISSEDNLSKLDKYREISKQLSNVRGLDAIKLMMNAILD